MGPPLFCCTHHNTRNKCCKLPFCTNFLCHICAYCKSSTNITEKERPRSEKKAPQPKLGGGKRCALLSFCLDRTQDGSDCFPFRTAWVQRNESGNDGSSYAIWSIHHETTNAFRSVRCRSKRIVHLAFPGYKPAFPDAKLAADFPNDSRRWSAPARLQNIDVVANNADPLGELLLSKPGFQPDGFNTIFQERHLLREIIAYNAGRIKRPGGAMCAFTRMCRMQKTGPEGPAFL